MNELKSSLEKNKQDRIWFIKKWAEYIRTHSDKEWSRQQNTLINSVMENAKYPVIDVKTYLKIKKEFCKR